MVRKQITKGKKPGQRPNLKKTETSESSATKEPPKTEVAKTGKED